MPLSTYLQTALLNHVFGSGAYAKPTGLYVALYTSPPNDAGGGVEVAGGAYARAVVPTQNVSGASPAKAANGAEIAFPAATADWGTITAAAIFDAPTGGNMLDWGALSTAKLIQAGDIFRFPATQLATTLN